VFPCDPKGKRPLFVLVPNGHKNATTDFTKIRAWWKAAPTANIGLVPPKSTAIVDVDPRNGGTESLKALKDYPALKSTLRARTGGGGFHLVLNNAPSVLPGKLGPGLDLKSNGRGYVIVAPSIHESGKRYEWEGGFHPETILPWPKGMTLITPHTLRANGQGLGTNLTHTQIKELMRAVSPEEYDTWVAVGQALKSVGDPDLFSLWDMWSKNSEKYPGTKETKRKWETFRGEGRGIGTLVFLAGGKIPHSDPSEDFAEPPEGILNGSEQKGKRGPTLFRPIVDIVAERREAVWLLDDLIETKVLGVLAGPRGAFKSFIVLDWAMRTAQNGHGVLILNAEGGGLGRRVEAWVQIHAPDMNLRDLPMVAVERPLNLDSVETLNLVVTEIRACAFPVKLIIVDTLSKYSPGVDENDNTEMSLFLTQLAVKFRNTLASSVLLVAHSGHSDPGRPRGASALGANTDVEFIVHRPDPQGMTVTVSRERFKDAEGLPRLNYLAEVVDLGRLDARMRPVTSLALRETGEIVETQTPKNPNEKIVWRVVCSFLGLGVESVEVGQVITEAVKQMVFDSKSGKRDLRRQAAERALTSLSGRDFLKINGGRITLKNPEKTEV
jgi:hypothetical protein